jgi:hypothetical protein
VGNGRGPTVSRQPWLAPEIYENRRALWRAARRLSDTPEQYWSFPMMTNRVLVSGSHGLNFTYESPSTWPQASRVLAAKRVL